MTGKADMLKVDWRADAELATTTRTRRRRGRGPVSLTAFSRTDRTVPDYGVHAGHLVGR